MTEVKLPHNFEPRDYQMPLWSYLENGGKRAVAIWHRRAGKDLTALNFCVTSMIERPGLYWHLLPTYNQGRKIVWDGMDKTGRPFLDAFPKELIKGNPNNTDMKLELLNGSMYQVVGTDWVDRLVGANPVGCIFSEYSLQDPRAWDLIRPILLENGGWALFVYTPRGKNHGYKLMQMAKANPKLWFSEMLTINDTGVITQEQINDERQSGMSEELIQQEFYCSFEAGIPGAYFSVQGVTAKNAGRFGRVPIHSDVPVDTYWDLGMDDSMSIWFAQDIGREIHLIDYLEGAGEGLPYYAKELARKGYLYGRHFAPHDIKVRELGSGKSRRESARNLGIDFIPVKKIKYKEDAINAARNIFAMCWFDSVRCARGIDALENYKKEYDDKKKVFMATPVHDWAAHGADAFMTLACSHEFRNSNTNNIIRLSGYRRQLKVGDSVAGY
jgi:phage terminase large subunit